MKRAIVLTACAFSLVAAAPASRPPQAIAFEESIWGRLLASWHITADGRGIYTKSEGRVFGRYRLVTRRFAAGPAAIAKLDAVLAPAARYAGRAVPCGPAITDLAYGTVTWTTGRRERRIRFDTGCLSAEAKRVQAAINAADALVAKWSASGPIVESREVAP